MMLSQRIARDFTLVLVPVLGLATSSAMAQEWSWELAVSGDWSNSARWTGPGGIPNGSGHVANIDIAGSAYTVWMDQNVTLDRLDFTSGDALFVSNGKSLTLDTSGTLSGGAVQFNGGSIGGGGTLYSNTTFDCFLSVNISTPTLTQDGTMNVIGSPSGAGTLTRTGDLFNGGTMNLTSNAALPASLDVSGQMTNNGTLNIEVGSGGARSLTVTDFDNAGTTNINASVALNGNTGDYTNSSVFNIAEGATATLSGSGIQSFNQTAGLLSNLGSFVSSGEEFNFSGGQITGNPIRIVGGSLNIFPNTNDVAAFDITNSVAFTGSISGNQVMNVIGSSSGTGTVTVGSTMNNAGQFNLTSTASLGATLSSTFPFKNEAGGTLSIEAGSGGARTLQTTDFTNDGTLNMNASTALNGNTGIYINNGTWTIAPAATATLSGSGIQTFNQSGNLLDVQGAFVCNGETFNFNGGTITGTAIRMNGGNLNIVGTASAAFDLFTSVNYTGNITPAQTVQIIGSPSGTGTMNAQADLSNSGQLTFTSTAGLGAVLSTGSTVTNNADGVIDILPGAGGARTLNVSNFINNGTVNANASTTLNRTSGSYTNNASFNIGAGSGITLNGSGVLSFNQDGGTLDVQGGFTSNGETFNYNGGSITGNDIDIAGGTLNIATAGPGNFDLVTTVTYAGDISGNQSIDIIGSPSGTGTMSASGNVNNSGVLTLTSTAALGATITSPSTLTNNAGGIINIEAGSGGARTLNTTGFVNDGTVNVNASTTLNATSGTYTNNGSMTVAGGTTITMGGGGVLSFNQNAGTLNLLGNFVSNGETFNYNGGTISGSDIQLNGGSLNLATPNAGRFDMITTVNHSGNTSSNQAIDIIGSPNGTGTLSASGAFSNSGIITMTSTAATGATISSPSLVTNNSDGQIIINPGSGGARTITASLTNDGLLDVNAHTTVNAPSGTLTNRGMFDIASGAEIIISGSGTVTLNNDGGTITGGGILDLNSSDVVVNNGITAPGSSAGTLTVQGNWNQGSGGQLQIEVGGTNAGVDHDVLAITGAANLDGALHVSLINGFTPSVGDSFTILTATGGVSGRFSQITYPQLGGAAKPVIEYQANAVIIRLDPVQTGDNPVKVDPIN